jgi:hypothetical protein
LASTAAAVKARYWADARTVYDRSPWELRQLFVSDTCELDGVEEFLREVVRRDPADTVAATMLGARVVEVGWNVRTERRAKYVSTAQFATFHQYLRQAEEILDGVCLADLVNPPAWCERIRVARGLELGTSEGWRRYDELSRHVRNYRRPSVRCCRICVPSGAAALVRCTTLLASAWTPFRLEHPIRC